MNNPIPLSPQITESWTAEDCDRLEILIRERRKVLDEEATLKRLDIPDCTSAS